MYIYVYITIVFEKEKRTTTNLRLLVSRYLCVSDGLMFYRLKNVRNRAYELTSCCFVVEKQIFCWPGVDAARPLRLSSFLSMMG